MFISIYLYLDRFLFEKITSTSPKIFLYRTNTHSSFFTRHSHSLTHFDTLKILVLFGDKEIYIPPNCYTKRQNLSLLALIQAH